MVVPGFIQLLLQLNATSVPIFSLFCIQRLRYKQCLRDKELTQWDADRIVKDVKKTSDSPNRRKAVTARTDSGKTVVFPHISLA